MERVFTGWLITARWVLGVVQSTEAGSWETAVTQYSPISTTKDLVIPFLIAETGDVRSTQVFENGELK